MLKENVIRKKFEEGTPTVATRIWSTNPFITETIGNSGNFDYIEFAAEYAPFSQIDLENICRAAELYSMGTLIKVDFQNRAYVAQKAIAAGFQAVMFADHETPEEVEESIRLTMPATPDCGGRFVGRSSRADDRSDGASPGNPAPDETAPLRARCASWAGGTARSPSRPG